jgi:hypothetical protein
MGQRLPLNFYIKLASVALCISLVFHGFRYVQSAPVKNTEMGTAKKTASIMPVKGSKGKTALSCCKAPSSRAKMLTGKTAK